MQASSPPAAASPAATGIAAAGPAANAAAASIAVALAAAIAELLLVVAALNGRLGVGAALMLHGAVLAALAAFVAWLQHDGRDVTFALLALIGTAATGPLGALGAAVAAFAPGRTDEALLAAWYRRISDTSEIDAVTRLCDNVSIGRTLDLNAPPPRSLASVMRAGTLAERQAALGLVARSYRPGHIGALHLALRSPEPVIRAQAAAVAARVRTDIKAYVRTELERPHEETPDVARAALLEAHAASGLLDDVDRARASHLAMSLRVRAAAGGAAAGRDVVRLAAAGGDRAAIEKQLLSEGRYADLRSLRRIRAATRSGRFAVRRRAARAATAEHA